MAKEKIGLTPEEKLLHAIFGKIPKSDVPQKPLSEEAMQKLREKVEAVLKTLSYHEREIIKLRYGLGDGYTYTLEEVGRIFKQNRERVRKLEAKVMIKLQHTFRGKKLED